MDTEAFQRELAEQGYAEVLTRQWSAGQFVDTHTHSFAVRALVLDGELVLSANGKSQALRAGDVFTLEPNCPHTEQYGPAGATFLVGRRYPADPERRA